MERNEIVMLVARNIQAIMERKGTNAAEVARAARLNPTGVYDIMSGKSRSPRLDTIAKIAAALRVPVATLFEEQGEGELRDSIIEAVSLLSPEERRRILVTARAWASSPASH